VVGWHHGECEARAYNGGLGAEPPAVSRGRAPGQGVRRAKPPEAESILVIGCPTEPANLAPLVKFSKSLLASLQRSLKKSEHSHEKYRGKTQRLPRFLREYRGEVRGCPGGVGAYGSSHICHLVASVSNVKLTCLPGTHHPAVAPKALSLVHYSSSCTPLLSVPSFPLAP